MRVINGYFKKIAFPKKIGDFVEKDEKDWIYIDKYNRVSVPLVVYGKGKKEEIVIYECHKEMLDDFMSIVMRGAKRFYITHYKSLFDAKVIRDFDTPEEALKWLKQYILLPEIIE